MNALPPFWKTNERTTKSGPALECLCNLAETSHSEEDHSNKTESGGINISVPKKINTNVIPL